MKVLRRGRPLRKAVAMSLGAVLFLPLNASAGDYYDPPTIFPSVKIGRDSMGATPVEEVFGKEYSHNRPVPGADPNIVSLDDHDEFGVPDPLQVVSWDGREGRIGGNSGSVNAFDYGASPGFNYPRGEVDALANSGDALFKQVIRNEAALLFSTTGDSLGGIPKAHVHYEDPVGGDGIWAAIEAPPVGFGPGTGVNHHPVQDLDALEVWGPEPPKHDVVFGPPKVVVEGYLGGFPGPATADSNRFSLDSDSTSGISVWAYDIGTTAITPWLLHSELVTAVEKLFLPAGFTFDSFTRDRIDIDGLMTRDTDGIPALTFVPGYTVGDEALISIDPVMDPRVVDPSGAVIAFPGLLIDGGEVFHMTKIAPGVGPATIVASFLSHGGHLWDTAFPVAATFGYDFEDIDALEAVGTLTGDTDINVPEPAAALLLLMGFPVLWRRPNRV